MNTHPAHRSHRLLCLLLCLPLCLCCLLCSCRMATPTDDTPSPDSGGISQREDAVYDSSILSLPTVATALYIGQPLSEVPLTGGEGSVAGSFCWRNPALTLTASGSYELAFVPEDTDYRIAFATLTLQAEQLTVTITTGEHGSAEPSGVVCVDYGEALTVTLRADVGYAVDTLLLDGTTCAPTALLTLEQITSPRTLQASFAAAASAPTVTCISGTPDAYRLENGTLTFTAAAADAVYALSGALLGSVVVDVGEEAELELQLDGLTVWSENASPIVIQSGDKVTLTALAGSSNCLYDLRDAVDGEQDTDAHRGAVYAACDLLLRGEGSLLVESAHNCGIHTKDDLRVRELSLMVRCSDNALKGNDSVTVESGKLTLIATAGDAIKTANSDVSDKGNQRGTVTLSGGTLALYAAADGIDAAYDVHISETDAPLTLEVLTDRYSPYSSSSSQEAAQPEGDTRYLRFTSDAYYYSLLCCAADGSCHWINATHAKTVSAGRHRYEYYSLPTSPAWESFTFFMYARAEEQGQDETYLAASDQLHWNTAYDTFALVQNGSSLSYSWTNYSETIDIGGHGGMGGPGGMGAPGGMGGGNSDKGSDSTKGVKAGNAIVIEGGSIHVESYDDAIHASNDTTLENGAAPTGDITVAGGVLTICTNDDGIHADGTLHVKDGVLTIEQSYEGLEGSAVIVSGGSLSIIASDDGINSPATEGTGIELRGGSIYILAGGDGVDSNSRSSYAAILFSGSDAVILTTKGGNSSIDSEGGYRYSGGRVLAIMPSGGMMHEATRGMDFEKIATTADCRLSQGSCLAVDEALALRSPVAMNAFVVYLGSNDATISTTATPSGTPDANGVWFH